MQAFFKLNDVPGFNDILNEKQKEDDVTEKKKNSSKLNKIEYTSKNNEVYNIIRYDKNVLSVDLISLVGLLRSVVVDKNKKVLSFAPPKSIPYDTFIKMNPEKTESIVAEQFVEGTMINVFWDENSGLSGSWEFATRNTVGGDVSFYKSSKETKTFRTMFLEAVKENNLDINVLNPRFCYSFVLQHPDNRIVVPFKKAQLYLVSVYEIVNTENGTVNIFPTDLDIVKKYGYWNTTNIKFPETYNWNTYEDLKNSYASMNTSYDILGVVIRNKDTCIRTKLRNPVYEYVRQLRGNQPKIQYQYLSLRKEGKVGEFLKFYPENKKMFSFFRDNVHNFTKVLHQNYINCYIKKEKPLKEYADQFRTHMFNIHKIYMSELKPKNDFVTNTVVINYVNNLHPSLLMYSLNACLRKRSIDFIKSDLDSPY